MSDGDECYGGKSNRGKGWINCRKNQFYPNQGGVHGEWEICARAEEGQ